MQFDVRSNIADVRRWLDVTAQKQVPFATVVALTMTAKDIQAAEVAVMQQVFDRPTPYTLNALKVTPATKATMTASVGFKEGFGGTPAKRFLNPESHGGPRSQRASEKLLAPLMGGASYFVPGSGATPNQYGNLSGAFYKRVVSQLKVSSDPLQNVTASTRSKKRRSASAFFIPKRGGMVMERKGAVVTPVLIFTRTPTYAPRFPFEATAARVLAERFEPNFAIAFERAMASAAFKGKWR
jgi:hypothetical protein